MSRRRQWVIAARPFADLDYRIVTDPMSRRHAERVFARMSDPGWCYRIIELGHADTLT